MSLISSIPIPDLYTVHGRHEAIGADLRQPRRHQFGVWCNHLI